jgi:phosphoglycerol transferase
VLLATVGGFSGVIAYLVTPQLRAWARMSIFIEFFALAAVAVLADQLAIRRGMRVGGAVLATLLVIGFLDQTNAGSVPEYAATAARYRSDAALVKTLEAKLPRGARVFELPYEPFPEPQPAFAPPDLGPYDMARPYLHSHHLRWSYGLMKGRAGDWQAALVALPPALVARALVAAGFSGIYVDRGGYADGAAYVVNALSEATGAQPISSPDGRLAFVDLRAFGRNLQASRAGALPSLRRAVLRPLTITYPGLSALRQTAEGRSYLTGQTGEISVENPGPAPRTAVFAARLASATSGQATVVLTFPGPGQRPLRIVVDARGKPLQRRLELPPGVTRITLSVRGRAQFGFPLTTRPYYLRVQDPLLVDSAFQPLGTLPADRRAASFLSPFGPI